MVLQLHALAVKTFIAIATGYTDNECSTLYSNHVLLAELIQLIEHKLSITRAKSYVDYMSQQCMTESSIYRLLSNGYEDDT